MKTVLTTLMAILLVLTPFAYARAGSDTQSRYDTIRTAAEQQQLEQQMREVRRQLAAAAHRLAELTLQMAGPNVTIRMRRLDLHRAVLGISIGDTTAPQSARGVSVMAVTPGGPAEKAGIRAGDVITAINGVAFRSDKQESATDKLVDFMDKVKPGAMLKLSYVRSGRDFSTEVKAGRLSDYFALGMPPIPPVPPVPPANLRAIYGPPYPYMYVRSWGGPWSDMQLVPLSPTLGRYFGTDQGLLVVHAPPNPVLKLRDGDVILKIGGREPGTPPHAMRILYSYGPGETLKLGIMRRGKPMILSITLPKAPKPKLGPNHPWSLRDQAFIARWVDQGLG